MVKNMLICLFLLCIAFSFSQDFEIPFGYRKYDQWKKSIPKNKNIPSQLIKLKIQNSLQKGCGIDIKKTVVQTYKGLWQTSFYIIYKTDVGYLSVIALCNATSQIENIKILKINFFSQIDDSLFKYVQLTPSNNSKKIQQYEQQQYFISNKQFILGNKKQFMIDIGPLFIQQENNNFSNQISIQCKNRIKIKNQIQNKQFDSINSFSQYIQILKNKKNKQENIELNNSIRKVAESIIIKEINKDTGNNLKKNLQNNQSP